MRLVAALHGRDGQPFFVQKRPGLDHTIPTIASAFQNAQMMRFQNEFVGDLDPPSLRRFGQVIRRRRWRCFHLIVGVNQVRGGEFGAAFTRHRNGSRWRGRHHAPECRVTASYRRRNLPSRPLRLLSACCGVLAVLNWGSVGLLRLGGGVQLSLDLAKIGAELCLAGRHNSLRAATPGNSVRPRTALRPCRPLRIDAGDREHPPSRLC